MFKAYWFMFSHLISVNKLHNPCPPCLKRLDRTDAEGRSHGKRKWQKHSESINEHTIFISSLSEQQQAVATEALGRGYHNTITTQQDNISYS